MNAGIDKSRMVPEAQLVGSDADLRPLADEARRYLMSHKWCEEVANLYFDRGFNKVAVLFAEIIPNGDADSELWVVVGDLPPLYIDTSHCSNGAQALRVYMELFEAWTDAASRGASLEGLPLIVARESFQPLEPTPDLCEALRGRIQFIKKKLLAEWVDELD